MAILSVREGKKVWPFCSDCGCRINKETWYHFGDGEFFFSEKDARGCKCPSLSINLIAGFIHLFPQPGAWDQD